MSFFSCPTTFPARPHKQYKYQVQKKKNFEKKMCDSIYQIYLIYLNLRYFKYFNHLNQLKCHLPSWSAWSSSSAASANQQQQRWTQPLRCTRCRASVDRPQDVRNRDRPAMTLQLKVWKSLRSLLSVRLCAHAKVSECCQPQAAKVYNS